MSKKITDAQIALFVSGELSEDQMLQIQNVASKDPEIAAKIKSMEEFDAIFKHDAVNNYPIPDAFYKKVKDQFNNSKQDSSKFSLVKELENLLKICFVETPQRIVSYFGVVSTSALGGALTASFCFVLVLSFMHSNNLPYSNDNQLKRGMSEKDETIDNLKIEIDNLNLSLRKLDIENEKLQEKMSKTETALNTLADMRLNFQASENKNLIKDSQKLLLKEVEPGKLTYIILQNQRLSLMNQFLLKQFNNNDKKWIIENTFAYKIDVKLPNGKIISYRPGVDVALDTEILIKFISFVDGILTQSDANISKNIEISANQEQNLAYVVEPSESKFALKFTWNEYSKSQIKTRRTKLIDFEVNIKE